MKGMRMSAVIFLVAMLIVSWIIVAFFDVLMKALLILGVFLLLKSFVDYYIERKR